MKTFIVSRATSNRCKVMQWFKSEEEMENYLHINAQQGLIGEKGPEVKFISDNVEHTLHDSELKLQLWMIEEKVYKGIYSIGNTLYLLLRGGMGIDQYAQLYRQVELTSKSLPPKVESISLELVSESVFAPDTGDIEISMEDIELVFHLYLQGKEKSIELT